MIVSHCGCNGIEDRDPRSGRELREAQPDAKERIAPEMQGMGLTITQFFVENVLAAGGGTDA